MTVIDGNNVELRQFCGRQHLPNSENTFPCISETPVEEFRLSSKGPSYPSRFKRKGKGPSCRDKGRNGMQPLTPVRNRMLI